MVLRDTLQSSVVPIIGSHKTTVFKHWTLTVLFIYLLFIYFSVSRQLQEEAHPVPQRHQVSVTGTACH